jgi:hypothetical protein
VEALWLKNNACKNFFWFIVKTLGGIIVVAIFFKLIAIYPPLYRLATSWANTPMLPKTQKCIITEIKSDDLMLFSEVDRRYQVTIIFDTDLKINQPILVHDPAEKTKIKKFDDYTYNPNLDTAFDFIYSHGGNIIQFNIISSKNNINTGITDCKQHPFKINFIKEEEND